MVVVAPLPSKRQWKMFNRFSHIWHLNFKCEQIIWVVLFLTGAPIWRHRNKIKYVPSNFCLIFSRFFFFNISLYALNLFLTPVAPQSLCFFFFSVWFPYKDIIYAAFVLCLFLCVSTERICSSISTLKWLQQTHRFNICK